MKVSRILTAAVAVVLTATLSANAAFIVEAGAGGKAHDTNFVADPPPTESIQSNATGLTPVSSVYGAPHDYESFYTPGIDADNTVFGAGTALGTKKLVEGTPPAFTVVDEAQTASGITGGPSGTYNVYITWPSSTNVDAAGSTVTITHDGGSIVYNPVGQNNAGVNVTDEGIGGDDQWLLLGQVQLTAGQTYSVHQVGNNPTFVSQRQAAVMWEAVTLAPCAATDPVEIVGVPLVGATSVDVSGVDASATAVNVYDITDILNPALIGTNISPTAGTTTVTVTALQAGQTIGATQTVGGQEGCVPILGPKIGDCTEIAEVTIAEILEAGMMSVDVSGVDAAAEAVTVYDVSGAPVVLGTNNSPTAGTTTVTVSALVDGQVVVATQTINTLEGCIPVEGPEVGNCSQIAQVGICGLLLPGLTTVTVDGVDPSATAVSIYANGAGPAIGVNNAPGGAAQVNVTVTALVLGDTISATQTLPAGGGGSLEGCVLGSGPAVQAGGVLEDFEGGFLEGNNPSVPEFGRWYDIASTAFADPAPGDLFGSDAVYIHDGGWTNGIYAVFEAVIPEDGEYHVQADMLINEADPLANTDAIRQYQIGVVANGAHRPPTLPLPAIDPSQPGQAIGSYFCLTPRQDGAGIETEVQTVTTGAFTAQACDSVLIAFSTHLEDAGHSSSTTWGVGTYTAAFMMADNIVLKAGPPPVTCQIVPPVQTNTGPLEESGTAVTVSGISQDAPLPTLVTVYADGEPIGSTDPSGNASVVVDVSANPLQKGQLIVATQTIDGLEGCVAAGCGAGAVVGSGKNTGVLLSLGIREDVSLTGPIGADGGANTSVIEWIGPTATVGGAPQGKLIQPSLDWQLVTFDPISDPKLSFVNGDGALAGTFGVLEHLAIAADPDSLDTGRYVLYIDEVRNGTDPPGLIENFDSPDHASNDQVMFLQPGFSGTTVANLLTAPDLAEVDSTQSFDGDQSYRVELQFLDEDPKRWVRLTTATAQTPQPTANPQVDLSQPITMRILLSGVDCGAIFADWDKDGDVDQKDFSEFQRCYTGDVLGVTPGCDCFDRDGNDKIDSDDLGAFNACASGPDVAADPACD